MVIDSSKFVRKSGDYAVAQGGGIADPSLLAIGTKYEEALSRSFKGLSPAEVVERFDAVGRVHWSQKYDGEGVLVFHDEEVGTIAFSAPSGRARMGMLALKETAVALKARGIRKALFRGELYLPSATGTPRNSIAEVTRLSFSTEQGAADRLALAIYDILMLDGKDHRDDGGGYEAEWDLLGVIFGEDVSKPAHRALGGWCAGSELAGILARILDTGAEGIVVRHEKERDYTKIKPKLSVDAAVIGYVEGSFDGKIGTRSLLLALNYPAEGPDFVFQTLARIGVNDRIAMELLEKLKTLKTPAPVILNDDEGREVHFIRPEIIVEIEGEDWIRSRSDGRPVRTQAYAWDASKAEWSYAGVGECPRMIFPTFAKIREDKSISSGGARISQALETPVLPARPTSSEAPVVLERQVYRKGKDAVRKFVLFRRASWDAVPFIFTYTDFSAGRKEPIKVSTGYAYTEKRGRDLLEASLAENVKKGWERV